MPLAIGDSTIGSIDMEHHVNPKEDIELLNVFANQAAVAMALMPSVGMISINGSGFAVTWAPDNNYLRYPRYGRQMNAENVGATIVVTTDLSMIKNLVVYEDFPGIAVSESNPDCPGIVLGNSSGITASIARLVEVHGYRETAFIKRPEHVSDARGA
jgi:hypothetical protein